MKPTRTWRTSIPIFTTPASFLSSSPAQTIARLLPTALDWAPVRSQSWRTISSTSTVSALPERRRSQRLGKRYLELFGPRIGFAYDVTGHGSTVIRGGFGTMYERIQGNDMYNAATNSPFGYNLNTGGTEYPSRRSS